MPNERISHGSDRHAHARKPTGRRPKHDHTVLVLQGGGALGAYQAGVYEGMAEQGFAPDWVTGVSIGAINASLIAGNLPMRVGYHDRRLAPRPAVRDFLNALGHG